MLKEILDNMKAEEEILEKSLIKLRKNISEKKADLDKESIELNNELADTFTKFPMLINFNDTLHIARYKSNISVNNTRRADGSIDENGCRFTDGSNQKTTTICCLYVKGFYIPVELVYRLSNKEIDDLKQEEA